MSAQRLVINPDSQQLGGKTCRIVIIDIADWTEALWRPALEKSGYRIDLSCFEFIDEARTQLLNPREPPPHLLIVQAMSCRAWGGSRGSDNTLQLIEQLQNRQRSWYTDRIYAVGTAGNTQSDFDSLGVPVSTRPVLRHRLTDTITAVFTSLADPAAAQ